MLIPATLPVTTNEPLQTEANSFSETNSVDSSVSSDDEDIITIVTTDRVTASVLHADTDTSSISVDQEQHIVTPLCSPSGESNTKQTDNVTVEDVAGMDMTSVPQVRSDFNNKKSVRFQDASHDNEAQPNSITAAVDKVFIYSRHVYVHL